MTHLVLPESAQKRIAHELSSIPAAEGKYFLTIEICCGSGGTLNALKVKRFAEDEMKFSRMQATAPPNSA